MKLRVGLLASLLLFTSVLGHAQDFRDVSWRYYRPGNTGIQGDYCEAIWIGPDNDPWIGGYDPGVEEGGVSKFIQAENRWFNVSNVDYPVIGHPNLTGTTRVSDIVADANGLLWMATWRGALTYDPAVGPSSLVNYASQSAPLANGGCRDLDIAPDGTVWFALLGFGGSIGRHHPPHAGHRRLALLDRRQSSAGWEQLAHAGLERAVRQRPAQAGRRLHRLGRRGERLIDRVLGFRHAAVDLLRVLLHAGQHDRACPARTASTRAATSGCAASSASTAGSPVFSLDYRQPNGTWVTPAQPNLPAVDPPIWAFRAFGDRQALLVDGNSRVWRFNGTSWADLGIWRDGDVHRRRPDRRAGQRLGLRDRRRREARRADRPLAALSRHEHQPVRFVQQRPLPRPGDRQRLRLRQRRRRASAA